MYIITMYIYIYIHITHITIAVDYICVVMFEFLVFVGIMIYVLSVFVWNQKCGTLNFGDQLEETRRSGTRNPLRRLRAYQCINVLTD